MRLWHIDLLKKLPRQQLLGQHRECCALRGLGWYIKHSTVDYVFEHNYISLYNYHYHVMMEMERRGYNVDPIWKSMLYRGKKIGFVSFELLPNVSYIKYIRYPEHNQQYYQECILNLKQKGVDI